MAEKKFIPVKVTDREWAEKLLDGEVFMRPLYEFGAWNLKKEDKQLNNSFRGDLCEGMSGIFGEVEECPIYDSFDINWQSVNLTGMDWLNSNRMNVRIRVLIFNLNAHRININDFQDIEVLQY